MRLMLRYLSLPLVILILVIGALIYVRMTNRAQVRREALEKGRQAEQTIEQIREELALQLSVGGTADLFVIQSLVRDYDRATKPRERKKKEIDR